MKKLIYSVVICIGIILLGGCSNENSVPSKFIGKWEMIGLGNPNDSEIREPEPKDCEECYVLNLSEDGTFYGSTPTNTFSGNYSINEKKNTISFIASGTKVESISEDQKLYEEYLRDKTPKSYSIDNNYLRLTYTNQQCFLFKK